MMGAGYSYKEGRIKRPHWKPSMKTGSRGVSERLDRFWEVLKGGFRVVLVFDIRKRKNGKGDLRVIFFGVGFLLLEGRGIRAHEQRVIHRKDETCCAGHPHQLQLIELPKATERVSQYLKLTALYLFTAFIECLSWTSSWRSFVSSFADWKIRPLQRDYRY